MPIPAGDEPYTGSLIASLEDFKDWLRRTTTAALDDDKLFDHLAAATEWVEWKIGGPAAVTTITESVYTCGWSIIPAKRPLVSVDSITPEESSTALPATAYKVDTTNHLIRFYRGASRGWYTLVYDAGLATVKRLYRNAGLELARHFWASQNGTVSRGRPDEVVPTPLGFAVPRRVDEMLTPNDLPGIA